MRGWGGPAISALLLAAGARPLAAQVGPRPPVPPARALESSRAGGASEQELLRREIMRSFADDLPQRAALLLNRYLEAAPDDGVMLYNAACAHCLIEEAEAAERFLLEAVKAGFLNFSTMQRDPDLTCLRERPAYRAIMSARDAADVVMARRRADDWRRTFGERYRFVEDEALRITFVTMLEEPSLARLRERVRHQARQMADSLFGEHLRHSILLAVATAEDAEEVFGDCHVHGSYLHGQRRLVVRDVDRSLRHELVHAWHHDDMDRRGQEHPFWIQEGLACLYERVCEGEAASGPEGGEVPPPSWTFPRNDRDETAAALVTQGAILSWPEFFALPRASFLADPQATYAQARAICAFLAAEGRLGDWYATYTAHFADDASGGLAFEKTFGEPLADIEARWRGWLVDVRMQEVIASEAAEPELLLLEEASVPVAPVLATIGEAALTQAAAHRLTMHGDVRAAVAMLQELVETEPDSAGPRYDLALAYVRLDRRLAAQTQLAALTALDPSLASLLRNLLSMSAGTRRSD